MRVFITKYALTKGIIEVEAILFRPGAIQTVANQFFYSPHWHKDRGEAVDQATKMLHAKIKSLKRQMESLEKKDEDPNWPQIKPLGTP